MHLDNASYGAATSSTTVTYSGLTVGNHAVKVKDSNGCIYIIDFTITQPNQLVLYKTNQSNVSCQGLNDGTVTLGATGGTTSYTYSIVSQPVGGSASILGDVVSNMKVGNYTFRVTDANLCTTDLNVTITSSVCPPNVKDDNVITLEDTSVSGNVLTNDSDPNGLPLSVTQFVIGGTVYSAGTTANISGIGSVVINTDGTYTFIPVPQITMDLLHLSLIQLQMEQRQVLQI
jgi:ribosomal protein S27E